MNLSKFILAVFIIFFFTLPNLKELIENRRKRRRKK
jgi:hypothetical protein